VNESTKRKEVGEEEKKEWREKVLPFIVAQSVLAVLACSLIVYLSIYSEKGKSLKLTGFTVGIVYLATSVVSEIILKRTTAQTKIRKEKASLHNFLALGILLITLVVYERVNKSVDTSGDIQNEIPNPTYHLELPDPNK